MPGAAGHIAVNEEPTEPWSEPAVEYSFGLLKETEECESVNFNMQIHNDYAHVRNEEPA